MALEAGQVYRWTLEVHNEAGAAADPDTIDLTITLPDGTDVDGTTQNPSVGHYTCDYKMLTAGMHRFRVVTTNPDTARTDYIVAREFISLISMAEAKEHLGMDLTLTSEDEELSRMMQAATEVVETKGGYSLRRTVTDLVRDGGRELALPRRPVLSVTSVTSVWEGGPTWTDGFWVDKEAGTVALTNFTAFYQPPWDVVYEVGRTVPPEKHLHAVKELLRHLWQTQRGPSPTPPMAGEESFTTAAGWSFSVPRRVLELIEDEVVPAI